MRPSHFPRRLIETNRRERHADRLRASAGALREEWVVKIGGNYVPVRLLDGLVTIPFEMDMRSGR